MDLNFKSIREQNLPSFNVCYNLGVYVVCSVNEEFCENTNNAFYKLKEDFLNETN